MTAVIPGRLDALAVAIRTEVEAADAHFASAVEHAIRAGELLIEAKSQVGHGEWLPWLKANFPASVDTAGNYMRLARNSERVRNLPGVRAALDELAAPKGPDRVESLLRRSWEAAEADEATESAAAFDRAVTLSDRLLEDVNATVATSTDIEQVIAVRDTAARLQNAFGKHHLRIERKLGRLMAPRGRLAELEDTVEAGLAEMRAGLRTAYERGVQTVLGHASWEAYVRAEFGPVAAGFPPDVADVLLVALLEVAA